MAALASLGQLSIHPDWACRSDTAAGMGLLTGIAINTAAFVFRLKL